MCKMTENMQADVALSRKAVFVRGSLEPEAWTEDRKNGSCPENCTKMIRLSAGLLSSDKRNNRNIAKKLLIKFVSVIK